MKNINPLENILERGYKQYLKLPLNESGNFTLYSNRWYMGIIGKEPRHYTYVEFVYKCGLDPKLNKKFIEGKIKAHQKKRDIKK